MRRARRVQARFLKSLHQIACQRIELCIRLNRRAIPNVEQCAKPPTLQRPSVGSDRHLGAVDCDAREMPPFVCHVWRHQRRRFKGKADGPTIQQHSPASSNKRHRGIPARQLPQRDDQ